MRKYILLLITAISFGQASDQMVTFTQAQSLGFSLKSGQTQVTSNQCMTKLDILTKYNVTISGYADNQLVPRSAWVNGVNYFTYTIASGATEGTSATCSSYSPAFSVYSASSSIQVPMTFYSNTSLTVAYSGGNLNYYYQSGNQLLTIDNAGSLTATAGCVVADTTPPTATTAVSAVDSGTNNIQVSWNAATDNVGLLYYDIYRNGVFVNSIDAASTTYFDSGLCNLSYYYEIITIDTAGNSSQLSAPSNTVTITQSTTACIQ